MRSMTSASSTAGPAADVVAAQVQVVHPVQQQREPVGARDRREERVDAGLGGLVAQQARAELAHAVDGELLVGAVERVLDARGAAPAAPAADGLSTRIDSGAARPCATSQAKRATSTVVLPRARAAEHEQRPAGVRDRARLASVRSARQRRAPA